MCAAPRIPCHELRVGQLEAIVPRGKESNALRVHTGHHPLFRLFAHALEKELDVDRSHFRKKHEASHVTAAGLSGEIAEDGLTRIRRSVTHHEAAIGDPDLDGTLSSRVRVDAASEALTKLQHARMIGRVDGVAMDADGQFEEELDQVGR